MSVGITYRPRPRYSPFGIGFSKHHLFAAGGGPALYLRPDLIEKQQDYVQQGDSTRKGFHSHLWAFVTPFAPRYAPQSFFNDHWKDKPNVDYSHEREWRVPHDFKFRLDQVEFIVVETYEDVARFPNQSNLKWMQKRPEMMKHSLLPINQMLCDKQTWDETEILARGQQLFDKALTIWTR